MSESEAPSNRQVGARVFNRPGLLAGKEAVCVYAPVCRCRLLCPRAWSGGDFVDRNSFPFVVHARVTTCTY